MVERKASKPVVQPEEGFMTIKQLRARERAQKVIEYDRIVDQIMGKINV